MLDFILSIFIGAVAEFAVCFRSFVLRQLLQRFYIKAAQSRQNALTAAAAFEAQGNGFFNINVQTAAKNFYHLLRSITDFQQLGYIRSQVNVVFQLFQNLVGAARHGLNKEAARCGYVAVLVNQYAQSNACRCLFGYIEVFGQVAGDFAVLQLAVACEGLCILQITRYDNITRADAATDIQLAIFQGQKCIGVFHITAHCAAFGICYYLAQRAVALQTQADALVILHCCGQQQRAVHRTSQSSACQMGAAVLFSCFLYQISGA